MATSERRDDPNDPLYARSVAAVFLSVDRGRAGRVFLSKNRRWPAVARNAADRMFVARARPADGDAAHDGDLVANYGRELGHQELQRHGVGIGRLGLDGRMLTPSELKELVASPRSLERFPPSVARFLDSAARADNALFVLEGRLAESVASEFLEWAPPSEPAAEPTVPRAVAELPRRLAIILEELVPRWNPGLAPVWRLERGDPNCLVIATQSNATNRRFLTNDEVDLLGHALASLGKKL